MPALSPFEYNPTSATPTRSSATSNLNRVSRHPLYHSISVAPDVFEEQLLERHREAFHHGARQGSRLLNDDVDVVTGQDREHPPSRLTLHGLYMYGSYQ
jgi:hypothetical protein